LPVGIIPHFRMSQVPQKRKWVPDEEHTRAPAPLGRLPPGPESTSVPRESRRLPPQPVVPNRSPSVTPLVGHRSTKPSQLAMRDGLATPTRSAVLAQTRTITPLSHPVIGRLMPHTSSTPPRLSPVAPRGPSDLTRTVIYGKSGK
jgi:hypothetical protein